MDHLPDDFDIVVVGTGMVESVVSAAASRIGKRVLHIDRNPFYGGHWASFNLDATEKILSTNDNVQQDECCISIKDGEEFSSLGNNSFNIENVKLEWHIPRQPPDLEPGKTENLTDCGDSGETDSKTDSQDNLEYCYQERILEAARKFNIDLAPKLQYARGNFVELLISSNIARYSEYRSVSRVLTWLNGHLEVVPCSRSDVFANTNVSVIEKRMLMKLLSSLDDAEDELKQYENKSFLEFLKEKKLTPNLIHYVLNAISMSTTDTSCRQGVENTKRFLSSVGRFGKTPFLFSMYGSGEITQAFCRLSAVFGGIFALGQPLHGLLVSENEFKALVVGKQRIEAKYLVMGVEKSPEKFLPVVTKKYISRGVFITDKSIMESEKEHLTLLLYPPENGKNPVVVIELGTLTGTCPKNTYIVHLSSVQTTSPDDDFKHIVENLFATGLQEDKTTRPEKPTILWSLYFSLPDTNDLDLKKDVPPNIFLCPGPDMDLDFDLSIKKAKEIFQAICPEMEFLPRAPDPEEIIIEGEDDNLDHSSDM